MPARPSTVFSACSKRGTRASPYRLADTLRWVVSQRLAPKIGGGRHALLEIMGANMRTQESIVLGESEGRSFYEIIESSYPFGWRTFDQACLEAVEQGMIDGRDRPDLLHQTRPGLARAR